MPAKVESPLLGSRGAAPPRKCHFNSVPQRRVNREGMGMSGSPLEYKGDFASTAYSTGDVVSVTAALIYNLPTAPPQQAHSAGGLYICRAPVSLANFAQGDT